MSDSDNNLQPDIETASDGYAARFEGAVGQWFLRVQARAVLGYLSADRGVSVLDVGGGHLQLAEPLCRAGYRVTVHGSAASCRARMDACEVTRDCAFLLCPAGALSAPDRAFHTVLSFRMLAHYVDWEALVTELCRVAGDTIIVDYPSSLALNLIAPALFLAKKRFERNTRTWLSHRPARVAAAFAAHGFEVVACRKQFFLPMVFHRMAGSVALARVMEGGFRAVGLTRIFGSPVILKLRRAG
jgi:2-polyprenyl-3-methyl-5-hydroxy-6-metoxy-1,4-benzoquinol methylase